VSAHGATASLDAFGLHRSSAFWGSDRPDTRHQHAVPVHEGSIALGTIEVSIPNGRPLRSSDMRLLRAIADQAAVAFHNIALEAQLEGDVAALDRTTKELAGSRARIVEADDGARRSLTAGISREVLPHLSVVSDELALPAGALRGSPQRIDDMVAEVNEALESLRELSHGVFPAQLGRSGLEPALRSYLRERGLGSWLEITPEARAQRFAPRVEAAVYFAATRAMGTGPERGAIVLGVDENDLQCTVHGADQAPIDLQGIRDRVEAVGGTLRLSADALELRIPLTSAR
jgi:signal transduction histidine kinase